MARSRLDAAEKVEKAEGFAQVFPRVQIRHRQVPPETRAHRWNGRRWSERRSRIEAPQCWHPVSGATDAARAAAPILTAPGLSLIINGIEEARSIFARMTSYTLYRVAMTTDIMIFIVLGTIAYRFFPLTQIMIIALALLDDLPVVTIAYDDVPVPPKRVSWDMPRFLTIASVLGFLAVGQSFGLMYIGDTIWHIDRAHLCRALPWSLIGLVWVYTCMDDSWHYYDANL
jgi:H+-transporting ATPase